MDQYCEGFENIKKGTLLITEQLGVPTKAIALESIVQGKGMKNVLLVDCKGSDVGFYDEMGRVYVKDIVAVCDNEEDWRKVWTNKICEYYGG